MRGTFICCILLLLAVTYCQAWGTNNNKVNLRDDVKSITLRKEKYTTGRRASSVPQLKCMGGAASAYANTIETVQCQNVGWDGYDVQWKCEADLDKAIKFGKVEVSCEGYDYAEDPYILRGSCGLEYTLEYTSANNQPRFNQQSNYGQKSYHSHYEEQYTHEGTSTGRGIGKFLMFGIVCFIFYNVYKQCIARPYTSGHLAGGVGGAGGGHWGPGGGPGGPGSSGPYGGHPYATSCQPPSYTAQPAGTWRPGFWTGMAAGGFLGNMFNRGPPYRTGFFGQPRPSYGGGLSYGGGGFGGAGTVVGGGSRTATGYGGTRRR